MLRTVTAIVIPEIQPFEFGVVCEVFGIDRSHLDVGLPAFDFRVCTPEPGTLATTIGVPLTVEHGLDAVDSADLVVIVPPPLDKPIPEGVIRALQSADQRGAQLLSICTGAFALAAAGLLDGRRATTHWQESQQLARDFPRVSVDENVLYVSDGNIMTSAGTAAGIDACLHLIRNEFGARAASAIARGMVVPPHRDGGQAQFIDRPLPLGSGDTMQGLLVWLSQNLGRDHSIAELATRAHMSERSFARRFRAETGATPAAWIKSQRLVRAQELLEDTNLSIDSVARESGFGQSELLRHHFNKILGVSPARYRRTFRGEVSSL